jgi:hypothetical protein
MWNWNGFLSEYLELFELIRNVNFTKPGQRGVKCAVCNRENSQWNFDKSMKFPALLKPTTLHTSTYWNWNIEPGQLFILEQFWLNFFLPQNPIKNIKNLKFNYDIGNICYLIENIVVASRNDRKNSQKMNKLTIRKKIKIKIK